MIDTRKIDVSQILPNTAQGNCPKCRKRYRYNVPVTLEATGNGEILNGIKAIRSYMGRCPNCQAMLTTTLTKLAQTSL